MLWRRDWFSRSKFSFLWNTIYSIYLRITNSPSVIYRVEEEEGGTTNEKHHMIDIHWIYITEPPLPSRSGCSSDYVQPTVQTLPLKVLTLHFYLFHRNLKTLVHKVFCSGKISPYILQLCEHVQSNSLKKKVYFTCSLNVPHLSITPKLTK